MRKNLVEASVLGGVTLVATENSGNSFSSVTMVIWAVWKTKLLLRENFILVKS